VTYLTADLEDPVARGNALSALDPAEFYGIVHMSVPATSRQRLIDDPEGLPRQLHHAVQIPVELARWASRTGSRIRRFVLVGSTGGMKQPDVRAGAYALAKAAMEPLVSLLSHDLAAQGASVNLVRPGFMSAGLNQGVLARTMLSIAGRAHSGVLSQPADIAVLIAFLLGDHASQINGSILTVDGGVVPQ
jgi:3-oxoacyl-[acyl-carrier protein] reductase